MEPEAKKVKTDEANNPTSAEPKCKHFVQRKKRFCKMTVAKGKEYCGEHEPQTEGADGGEPPAEGRIPCPLDPKHSVYKKNLRKHLKICNARATDLPPYIVPGINQGEDSESSDLPEEGLKLSDVPSDELNRVIERVKELYDKFVEGQIQDMKHSHAVLKDELAKEEYGFETRKHLIQTASLLGCIDECGLFKNSTSFVEFGAGKGHLSFWLAQVLVGSENSKVILIDRMSHRHKKDNKIEDRSAVHRIRADIADFKMSQLDLLKESERIVAVSKHLCGAATDLTLRCLLQDGAKKTEAALIAVCCHHRCDWKSFVAKEFFIEHGIGRREFLLITKMASWAICGTGYSRERRKVAERSEEEEADVDEAGCDVENISVKQREKIGVQCKRILDYSRVEFLRKNGFAASLRYYVDKEVTLENVCILALKERT